MSALRKNFIGSPWGLLAFMVALAVCLLSGQAFAIDIPPLGEISAAVAEANPALETRRRALQAERNELRARKNAQNSACGAVRESDPAYAGCMQKLQLLTTDVERHVEASNRFNAALAMAVKAPVSYAEESQRNSATESPCKRSDTPQPGTGTVSPAMFVTQAQCDSAFNEILRLNKLRDNLTTKIAEIQRWGTGLRKDEKEFENMRVEAQHNLAWEFIDHVPVAEGLDALKGNPALKGLNVEKIKAAYEAVKGLLETERGISAKDDHEKTEKILEGNRALRNAMIDAAGLNEKNRALMEAVSKIINYGATTVIATSADNLSDRDKLKTCMTLVEALQPWWGLGVMGENIAERGVQYHEAGVALNSLHEAQSSNWNAHRFLTDKLNKVNDEVKEEQFIIKKYKSASNQNSQ